jgi:cytidylate kinase
MEEAMSVIAISRGSLTAARHLAEELGTRLGSRVISREEVIDAAERYGIDQTGISRENILGEFPPGFWERYADARHHYLVCFRTALLDFAVREPIIYHGNLAHVLLNDVPFTFRLRVNAPEENRVRMLMEERGYTRERAAAEVREMDRRRRRWVAFLYDADFGNTVPFDLVLNMRLITIPDAVDLVSQEIKKPAFQRTEETVKTLFDLRLASTAEAQLLHHHVTYGLGLEVKGDSVTGKVTVYRPQALADNDTIDDEIKEALEGLEGVKEIDVQVKS